MNVLVVDDQYDVVQGVKAGVDWQSLRIERVYHAYSAEEARTLLKEKDIHILLCDIEMPMETGLELYKWVREAYPALQCIFLSAHSEFEYAQEALQLGCFDYILQPASYETIQASIERAIHKIHANVQLRQLSEYGAYWRENKAHLLENCVRSFLADSGQHHEQLLRDLNNLDVRVTPHTRFCAVLIQLTKPSDQAGGAELTQELTQLTEPYRLHSLLVQLDGVNYLALLYTESAFSAPVERMMNQLIAAAEKKLACFIACYVSNVGSISMLKQHYQALCQMRQHNVALYSKVFTIQHMNQPKDNAYSIPDMQSWAMLIAHGSSKTVRDDIHSYLLRQKQLGVITAEYLARFHQDFIQMFLTAAKQMKLDASDIFFGRYAYADYIQSYTSLDKMLDLINFVLDYVEEETMGAHHAQDPVERAIAYINQNIEKNCSRAEIAEAIYINPEYLSRLFKKVKGISLNDYIATQKMEIAKSLLSSTSIPVHLIASKVGYSNFSYFSQVFKKYCGLAPLEYRQKG
ncbi:response regulator transcription factor [Paenibacillus ginsengarvi]|uniref:Response regulator n=1 Tax=Paenibacillus ginsengarvi TaxID=400777 RepID=A0A3B0CIW9_9BACL|nr:response regulator [Paenibacillus ginsengarvi]RKN84950.1 response regulator [Paenibacillus ginsengarvi]